MTPKEKAKEMVNKMHGVTPPRDILELLYSDKEIAKQCALIAVDEILKPFEYEQNNNFYSIHPNLYQLKYWHQVKNEIEAL